MAVDQEVMAEYHIVGALIVAAESIHRCADHHPETLRRSLRYSARNELLSSIHFYNQMAPRRVRLLWDEKTLMGSVVLDACEDIVLGTLYQTEMRAL